MENLTTTTFPLSVAANALAGDLRQLPRLARETGFAGLELDLVTGRQDITELSATGRREVIRFFASQGVELVAIRVELGGPGLGRGADIDRILSRFDQVLEAAAGLSAGVLCVDIGPLPAAPAIPKPQKQIKPEEAGLIIIPSPADIAPPPPTPSSAPVDPFFISQVDTALSELGHRADRYGKRLAFRSELAGFAALGRALAAAACPWFGLDLDPVCLLRDNWMMDQVFSTLGSMIWHLRGRDAQLGDQNRTKPAVIGQGGVQWTQLLADLQAGGYHGWLGVDPVELPDRYTAALAGAEYLRRG